MQFAICHDGNKTTTHGAIVNVGKDNYSQSRMNKVKTIMQKGSSHVNDHRMIILSHLAELILSLMPGEKVK